eukprot:126025_1
MTQPLTHYANTNNTSSNTNKNYYTSKLRNANNRIHALILHQSLLLLLLHYNNTNINKPNANTHTIPITKPMNNPTQTQTQNKTQPTSLYSSFNYTPNTTTTTATTATHLHTQPQRYTPQISTPYPALYPHRTVVTTTQPYQPQT